MPNTTGLRISGYNTSISALPGEPLSFFLFTLYGLKKLFKAFLIQL